LAISKPVVGSAPGTSEVTKTRCIQASFWATLENAGEPLINPPETVDLNRTPLTVHSPFGAVSHFISG
jgi:hypothetical protein